MARSFNKRIKSLKTFNQIGENTNVIYEIIWFYEILDDVLDMCKHIEVVTQIDTSDLSSFIPYESITESDLIDWIDANLTADETTNYQNQLVSKIDKLANGTQEIMWGTT